MKEETREKEYLRALIEKVGKAVLAINEHLQTQKSDIEEATLHLQEHKRDMDHLEKNALREVVSQISVQGEHAARRRNRLLRLKDNPYFGKIDFQKKGSGDPLSVYVGVHNFQDAHTTKNLVYDWRAPISSMFYDFEPGEVWYVSQKGTVSGHMLLKRQFRIRGGKMEYMLDSDVTIQDEVLQEELRQASSSQMKNIVATIQREQNAIIRNENARHLIIQGVAGSGKTSVALHRIAFLLYRFKDVITSRDILIISPNKVFAGYIANVLPELGEETIEETSLEEIARELFLDQISFQSFFEQVSQLLEKRNDAYIERIQFKSSAQFLSKIDQYLVYLDNHAFKPRDIVVGKKPVPSWFIENSFRKYRRLPILKRFNEMVNDIVKNVLHYYQYEIKGAERTDLHKTIRKMFPSASLKALYKGFYQWLDRPELLKVRKGGVYEYADVYPLLYMKIKLEGIKPFAKVKHLVVDEMQDYSVVQYKVLSHLFPCKKTILGDINQSVNPFSASDLTAIESVFSDAQCIRMVKSYRSTWEITQFTRQLGKKTDVEAIERHGKEPEVMVFDHQEGEMAYLKERIEQFASGDHNSLGVICKTQDAAAGVYEQVKAQGPVRLLDAKSTAFGSGIVITTAHLAKGLEFDSVIVPHCTQRNYQSEADMQMLYVATTRAMHILTLTAVNTVSPFLKFTER